jgi:hypothetical protein
MVVVVVGFENGAKEIKSLTVKKKYTSLVSLCGQSLL